MTSGTVRRRRSFVYPGAKSGITGWAQANGLRGNTSLADRVEWDNYYIENFSFWLDAKIVLMTFAAVFAGLKTVDEPS